MSYYLMLASTPTRAMIREESFQKSRTTLVWGRVITLTFNTFNTFVLYLYLTFGIILVSTVVLTQERAGRIGIRGIIQPGTTRHRVLVITCHHHLLKPQNSILIFSKKGK